MGLLMDALTKPAKDILKDAYVEGRNPTPDQIVVREYKNAKDFAKDAKKMARKGYTVQSTTDTKAGSGIGRKAFTALVFLPTVFVPHGSHIVVTYAR